MAISLAGMFKEQEQCQRFQTELEQLQEKLKKYTKMLADMADVEDLSSLEESN